MMSAVEYYGGEGFFTRISVSFIVCIGTAITLFKGDLDTISKFLGGVVALMTIVFGPSLATSHQPPATSHQQPATSHQQLASAPASAPASAAA